MKIKTAPSYPVSIFIAGNYYDARQVCREYCDEIGLCVTLAPTEYIYTGGFEGGLVVGLINYPRFPEQSCRIECHAEALGQKLMAALGQESFSIQTPTETTWFSVRPADLETKEIAA